MSVDVNNIDENIAIYPAVTICNINPFDSSNSVVSSFVNTTLATYNISPTITPTDSNPAIYQFSQVIKILKAESISKNNLVKDYGKNLSFSLDSMLISCYFNGDRCYSSNFSHFYSFEYGNCYTFNKDASQKTSKAGPENGLSMELFVGFPGNKILIF